MDISETYIKMCDCPEIQGLWSISEGDWYIDTVTFPHERTLEVQGGHPNWDNDIGERRYFKETQRRSIWLPRQDQLQEIWDEGGIDVPQGAVKLLYEYIMGNAHFTLQFTSMEQLWLAFVMKEKFNKVWDGEKWI